MRFAGSEWYSAAQSQYITLAGVGGIGSHLCLALARVGYKLSIYDDDLVEEHNLGGQLYKSSDINIPKVTAMASIIREFCGEGNYTLETNYERYTSECAAEKICISCFDNMVSRKIMFKNWLKTAVEEDWNGCIFIDGRMLMEQCQVFAVTNIKQAEDYWKNQLFSDKEAAEPLCSMKATTYMGQMIAAIMTTTLNNYMANVYQFSFREVPYYSEFSAHLVDLTVEV